MRDSSFTIIHVNVPGEAFNLNDPPTPSAPSYPTASQKKNQPNPTHLRIIGPPSRLLRLKTFGPTVSHEKLTRGSLRIPRVILVVKNRDPYALGLLWFAIIPT